MLPACCLFSQSPGSNPMVPSSTSPLPPPSSGPPYSTNAGSSPGSTLAGAVSTGTGQQTVRQPQATMNPPSTSPETIWSANSQTARATPPSTMSAGTSLLPIAFLMPRCTCTSEVYGSVFVCLCVCRHTNTLPYTSLVCVDCYTAAQGSMK